MEIFNIGIGELVFIIVLMILLLGPVEMVRLFRRAGELIRAAGMSPLWQDVRRLEREARDLPFTLAREAGIKEQMDEIRQNTRISIDYNLIETNPDGLRSSGTGGLRPPQQRGAPAVIRSDTTAGNGDEAPAANTPAEITPAENTPAPD